MKTLVLFQPPPFLYKVLHNSAIFFQPSCLQRKLNPSVFFTEMPCSSNIPRNPSSTIVFNTPTSPPLNLNNNKSKLNIQQLLNENDMKSCVIDSG